MSKKKSVPVSLAPFSGKSRPQPADNGPNSNIAVFLNQIAGKDSNAVEAFGSAVGALADISGAIGIVGAVQQIISLFNQQSDPLQPIETELQSDFAQLYSVLEEQFNEQRWIELTKLTSAAESVLQQMSSENFITSDPDSQIETCLTPLNTLSDTTEYSTNVFFTLPYAYHIAWTDGDDYLQPSYFQNDDGSWSLLPQSDWNDTGFGDQAAPPFPGGTAVFFYTYVLPYYIRAVYILLAVGRGLFPDFGAGHSQTLIGFADFLSTIHQTIVGAIAQLLAPPPGPQGWLLGPDAVLPGITLDVALDELGNPAIFGASFEIAAVELYSGGNSIRNKYMPFNLPDYPGDAAVYRKLQLRALAGAMDVYKAIGLTKLSHTINSLRKVALAPPLPDHPYRNWSVREALGIMNVPPETFGLLSVSALIQIIVSTPPFDVDEAVGLPSLRAALAA